MDCNRACLYVCFTVDLRTKGSFVCQPDAYLCR